ncbi:hypothetical protein Vafri_8220 [Volvox africanus]|nr:hypothetical protein Vafri_8220 [Volvox africanus]
MLRNFAGRTPSVWDTYLTAVEFAINNAVNRSTGQSPFFLNYGYHPALPVWCELEYNKSKRDMVFSKGQLVILNTKNLRSFAEGSHKLLPHWLGLILLFAWWDL